MSFLVCRKKGRQIHMKKGRLLNSSLSAVVAKMGHKQHLTIGDAGLPIPPETTRIDLAVSSGVPTFLDVLDATLSELCVEKIILAEEIKEHNPQIHTDILERTNGVEIEYVPHEQFKAITASSRAIVRTGETTPYANVILVSGVTF
jgi:ABC-type ribose transport system, auxiliary component